MHERTPRAQVRRSPRKGALAAPIDGATASAGLEFVTSTVVISTAMTPARWKLRALVVLASSLIALPGHVAAATGVCDATPTSPSACINAIQTAGGVVNDIFRDSNGLTGPQLPLFGTLFNSWSGCDAVAFAGCSGQSQAPFDCPGQYSCTGLPDTFTNASQYVNALDRKWWMPCRLADHTLVAGCPQFTACIADGTAGSYFPWEGLVFDLGAAANQVVVFAENDHGPQPCESLEYTVYLSDSPTSRERVQDPGASGVDPAKWNRAALRKIFTSGWVGIRPPDPAGHAACGDTPQYSVEQDSFVQVFALPAGTSLRYASIVAGNDGLDFAQCAYDSSEAEVDAVAGLTESGAGLTPSGATTTSTTTTTLPAPARSKCTSAEITAAGKKAAADAKCHANVVAKGDSSALSACLTKANTKFRAAYAKAAAKGDCINGTEPTTVEGKVATFTNDLVNTLAR